MLLKVGVGMIGTPNYWGIYYNAGIDAGGWEGYNNALQAIEILGEETIKLALEPLGI